MFEQNSQNTEARHSYKKKLKAVLQQKQCIKPAFKLQNAIL